MDYIDKNVAQETLRNLKAVGYNDKELAKVVYELAKSVFANSYLHIMNVFSDKEMQVFEDIVDESQRKEAIITKYEQKTGRKFDKVIDYYLERLVSGYFYL